jgi:hypothetical protein
MSCEDDLKGGNMASDNDDPAKVDRPSDAPKSEAPSAAGLPSDTGTQDTTPVGQEPTTEQPAEKALEGRALSYLNELVRNIETMLSHAANSGIALPDELRAKVDELFQHPAVNRFQPGDRSPRSMRAL